MAVRLLVILGLVAIPASVVSSQTVKPVTVGLLSPALASIPPIFIQAFRERGYEEGRNLRIEFRSAKGKFEELPKLAAELVSLKPDALVGGTTPAAVALKQATDSIPIVFYFVSDPVLSGLVKSFANPGGNVTGASVADEYWSVKTLQLITDTLPGICCVTILMNPSNQTTAFLKVIYEKTAKSLGIELRMMDAGNPDQLNEVLAIPLEGRFKTALLSTPESLFTVGRTQIVEYAQRQNIPLFAPYRADAVAGALMSFGASFDGQYRAMADYVDKILKGAKPADLPVQQPTTFELVLNLKVAKALGLQIPQLVLARATDLIE
ncbi:putative ABC transport system substrate-binding protein [Rhizobiales bacterium GAS191]|nr:putative ABC transport system substrate-binding protein [Rhizobiales bacterium GAS113]SED98030.1 putative ABC transport system substrate-binding protein [Rhizobiales bacterium GAS191]